MWSTMDSPGSSLNRYNFEWVENREMVSPNFDFDHFHPCHRVPTICYRQLRPQGMEPLVTSAVFECDTLVPSLFEYSLESAVNYWLWKCLQEKSKGEVIPITAIGQNRRVNKETKEFIHRLQDEMLEFEQQEGLPEDLGEIDLDLSPQFIMEGIGLSLMDEMIVNIFDQNFQRFSDFPYRN